MLNPNAIMTPTNRLCRCGKPIGAFYVVMLCDDCLEESIPEQTCHGCAAVSKHHPRMTRIYDGAIQKEARYYCADCAKNL